MKAKKTEATTRINTNSVNYEIKTQKQKNLNEANQYSEEERTSEIRKFNVGLSAVGIKFSDIRV